MRSFIIKTAVVLSLAFNSLTSAFCDTHASNKKIILSFDAGAIRGVMEVVMLQKLNELVKSKMSNQHPNLSYKGLLEYVDYIGGVSVGSTHTATLSIQDSQGVMKHDIDALLSYYIDNSGKHFPREKDFITKVAPAVFAPVLDEKAIHKNFEKYFGQATFANIRQKILVTSYNIELSQQTVWTNIGTEDRRRKMDGYVWNIDKVKLIDAVMSSSSASLALPAYKVKYQTYNQPLQVYSEADSAVIEHNCILTLISTIRQLENVKLSDMVLISLGSGRTVLDVSHLSEGGILKYASSFIDTNSSQGRFSENRTIMAVKGIVEATGGEVYSLEPLLSKKEFQSSFDDSLENIKNYIKIAEDYYISNYSEFDKVADSIVSIIAARNK